MVVEEILSAQQKPSFTQNLLGFLKDVLRKGKHKSMIKQSKKLLRQLNNQQFRDNPARFFGYVRKVNPFVFEELLLTTFAKRGFKIKRNKAYTGDGGIDGKVRINNQWWLIQAKRYQSHINPKHVEDYKSVIGHNNYAGGLFIHTGKTGGKSYGNMTVNGGQNIVLVSGHNLHTFISKSLH